MDELRTWQCIRCNEVFPKSTIFFSPIPKLDSKMRVKLCRDCIDNPYKIYKIIKSKDYSKELKEIYFCILLTILGVGLIALYLALM